MTWTIRQGSDEDLEELVQLSLLAWEPVFLSFQQAFGPEAFAVLYPDWRQVQRKTVETYCSTREHTAVWLVEVAGVIAGYCVTEVNPDTQVGQVQLLAVHPDHQRRGIATELNRLALEKLKEVGMKLALVGTGNDPGHAPARRAYEKAGYTAFHQITYFQTIT